MIGLKVSSNASEVMAHVHTGQTTMDQGLIRVVERGAIRIQSLTKMGYLNNQVLHQRSGRLARSIHVKGPTVHGGSGGRMESVEANVGTNVEYAGYHEFGFRGGQNVKAFTRETSMVFGRRLDHPVTQHVKPFHRTVNYGGRPFLRPAAKGEWPQIIADVKALAGRAFGGGNG